MTARIHVMPFDQLYTYAASSKFLWLELWVSMGVGDEGIWSAAGRVFSVVILAPPTTSLLGARGCAGRSFQTLLMVPDTTLDTNMVQGCYPFRTINNNV